MLKKLKKLLKKVRSKIPSLKKLIGLKLGLSLVVAGYLYMISGDGHLRPHTTEEFARTSVKITNLAENSGGSGVILYSQPDASLVLTNKHVCEVVKHGGVVIQENRRYLVAAYKVSNQHDLCEIMVNADLEVNTKIADKAPKKYSKAHISGHPALLPHVLTHGYVSGRMNVPVMIGMRKCNEKDVEDIKKNGDIGKAFMCLFGGIPIIKTFDSQLVTATILPGSSGSAVFDDNGEIIGLVFASGSRELNYAIIVPQEYVKSFVHDEAGKLEWQQPDENSSQDDLRTQ